MANGIARSTNSRGLTANRNRILTQRAKVPQTNEIPRAVGAGVSGAINSMADAAKNPVAPQAAPTPTLASPPPPQGGSDFNPLRTGVQMAQIPNRVATPNRADPTGGALNTMLRMPALARQARQQQIDQQPHPGSGFNPLRMGIQASQMPAVEAQPLDQPVGAQTIARAKAATTGVTNALTRQMNEGTDDMIRRAETVANRDRAAVGDPYQANAMFGTQAPTQTARNMTYGGDPIPSNQSSSGRRSDETEAEFNARKKQIAQMFMNRASEQKQSREQTASRRNLERTARTALRQGDTETARALAQQAAGIQSGPTGMARVQQDEQQSQLARQQQAHELALAQAKNQAGAPDAYRQAQARNEQMKVPEAVKMQYDTLERELMALQTMLAQETDPAKAAAIQSNIAMKRAAMNGLINSVPKPQASAPAPSTTASSLPTVNGVPTPYEQIPSGATYVDPNGVTRTKS